MKIFKTVDKYLMLEFLKPFLFLSFALTLIMLSGFLFNLTDFLIIKRIPIKIVSELLVYRVPQVLVDSISKAVLFSTILVFTRLVKDSEYTALRMAGINLWRLVMPVLILALLISGLSYILNERLVPWSNSRYQDVVKYSVYNKQDKSIHRDVLFKWEGKFFSLGVINDNTKQVKDILIYDKNRLITAKTAQLQQLSLQLNNANIYILDDNNYSKSTENYSKLRIEIGQEIDYFYKQEKDISEMNRSELKERINLFQASARNTNELLVEYHFNLAEVLVCVIFVLIGAPLSTKSNLGRVYGIIISLIIILIYYVFLSITKALGINGILTPVLAVWLPMIIFSVVGILMILKEDYFKIK